MNRPKIMGIGELVWDLLPDGRQLGGAPVNFAYWCNRLGAKGYPVSAVGSRRPRTGGFRPTGRDGTRSRLRAAQRPADRTGQRDALGERHSRIRHRRRGGLGRAGSGRGTLELAARADAVCWGSLAQRSETSRRAIAAILEATRPECLKVFDINIRQHWYSREIVTASLGQADVLKLNEDELPLVASLLGIGKSGAEAIAELVRAFSLRYVVYTAGADHSEIHGAEGLLSRIPTPEIEVADTVGAGDSFTAAFITSLLQGEPVAASHRKAVETAAKVCTVHGAIPRPQ